MLQREKLKPITLFSPAWKGGAGWFVQELAIALAESGEQIHMVSPRAEPTSRDPLHRLIDRDFLPQGAQGRGSLLQRCALTLKRIGVSLAKISRASLQRRIVVVTMPDWLVVKLIQFLLVRMLGGKLVYIVHDVTPHAWSFPKPLHQFERWLLKISYSLPDLVVTLTKNGRAELVGKYAVPQEQISVIPHGAHKVSASSTLSGASRILLFGMLRRNKSIRETLTAFGSHDVPDGVQLVVAGQPHKEDTAYWDECALLISNANGSVISEIGFVPEPRLVELLDECDAVILPYVEFNSQSGVAIMACLAERVVICTDSGGLAELIDAGLEAILIDSPVTEHSILDAVVRFSALTTADKCSMARRSKERISKYLSWDRIGEQYSTEFARLR